MDKSSRAVASPSQALLAAIIQSANEGVITTTLEGEITSANPAATAMFAFSEGEMLGRSVFDIAVPTRRHAVETMFARLARGEQIDRFRTVLVRKDGLRFTASITVALVPGAEGVPAMASAIIQDLSKGRDAEEAKALLAAIVESSEDAIYSRTADGTITSWNRSAERLFGYAAEEIIGQSIKTLVPQDVEHEFDELDDRIKHGEPVADQQTIRLRKDGRRIPVSITAFPVVTEGGTVIGVAMITRDMLRDAKTQNAFRNLERLTAREREVLGLISDGLANLDISRRLGLSQQTIKNYVSRILMKLDATSRTQAAASFLSLRSFLGPPAK